MMTPPPFESRPLGSSSAKDTWQKKGKRKQETGNSKKKKEKRKY